MDDRNGYMLSGRRVRRGYDWWWHSLVGTNANSGARQPFFIEYYVINPARGGSVPVLGQQPENQARGIRPSYAMIKAGTWRTGGAVQLHAFYPVTAFSADRSRMDVRIGDNVATESRLRGFVSVAPETALAHPELMSDPGEMSWDLSAEKVISYSVGYGTSPLVRRLGAFQMSWHIAGMLTRYRGRITFNGEEYLVEPDSSSGYQDKNWGDDYTSPWVWLNCNTFRSRESGALLPLTSLVVGGARPVVFGIPLPRRLLVAFSHDGVLHEFNFSKFWTGVRQRFQCPVHEDRVEWNIEAWNRRERIEIHFACPRDAMLAVNYENPDGRKRHNCLLNGGHAAGTVTLWRKVRGRWEHAGSFDGEFGGCEYGEHDA
jgi:tocopherol cyclase